MLGLTQHIRRLGLKALGLLTLQHVQQGLQAAQAQRGVREPRLFDRSQPSCSWCVGMAAGKYHTGQQKFIFY